MDMIINLVGEFCPSLTLLDVLFVAEDSPNTGEAGGCNSIYKLQEASHDADFLIKRRLDNEHSKESGKNRVRLYKCSRAE